VPAVGKERVKVPEDWVAEFVPAEKVTLCETEPAAHVQVTDPPAEIVAVDGVNTLLSTVTLAVLGGVEEVPVAVNPIGDPVAPDAEAWRELVPALAPSVHMVEAVPSVPVIDDVGDTDPPPAVTVHVTATPAWATPSWETRTTTGLARAVPTAAL